MMRWVGPVLVLVWLLARALHQPVLGAVAGLPLVDLLPGLALLHVSGFAGRSLAWRWTAAGALSLPLLSAVGFLAGLAGASPEALTWPVVALAIALLFVPARVDGPREETTRTERGLLALGVGLAAFVAVALLHPRLPRWSDSWFHAAVFEEVRRAGVHATFPHFADMPLPYPWFFHVYLVMLRPVVHHDPFVLMATVNQWTALLLPLAFFTLGRALGLDERASRWAAAAGLLGVNPFAAVIVVARSLLGQTTGWAAAYATVSNADAVQYTLAPHFSGFQSSWLARLWTPTAFDFALVLAIFVLVLVLEFVRTGRPRTLVLFTVAAALLLHWHTLTALQLSFGIAAGVACATAVRLLREGPRALLGGAAVAAGLLVAFAVARPYLGLVTLGGSVSVMRFALVKGNLFGLLLSMGPVAIAAIAAVASPRTYEPRTRAWCAGALAGLALPMLAFDLPGMAEEKLYWPLFLLAAAAGAPAIRSAFAWKPAGRLLVIGLIVSSVLGTALTAAGFLGDSRTLRSMFDREHPDLAPFYTRDERDALAWIRERSPRDAVFLQPLRPAGTEPILVHGERRLWLGFADVFYRATFFESSGRPPIPQPVWDELQRRDLLQRRAFSADTLGAATLDSLRARPWPVYVWWDPLLEGGRLSPTLADTSRVTRLVFRSPTVRILELRRAP
jgi:hypothetical protein